MLINSPWTQLIPTTLIGIKNIKQMFDLIFLSREVEGTKYVPQN